MEKILLYVLLVLILLIIIYFIITFNKFAKAKNKVKEAFATMDVYLKKRWDLIPNLVEIVKGYSKHENKTLTEVIKLRNGTYDEMTDENKISTNEKLNTNLNKLLLLVEKYPELKANNNYLELSKQLTKAEDEIANSRKYYNATVRDYNNLIETFPNSIVAKLFRYKKLEMFKAESEEKENIKVEL